MNSPERQSVDSMPPIATAEAGINSPITLVCETKLLKRIAGVSVAAEEFDGWVAERKGPAANLEPLTIILMEDNPPSRHGGVVDGDFQVVGGNSVIRLFLGNLFNMMGELKEEFDHNTLEAAFNDYLNENLVHEIEHWLQRLNDELSADFREEALTLARKLLKENETQDHASLMQKILGELATLEEKFDTDDRDFYLNQSHEVVARRASQLYPWSGRQHIIWCTLEPTDQLA